MLPVGFEPTISAGERPQTYALDRVATGTKAEICWALNEQIKSIMQQIDVIFHIAI